MNLSDVNKAVLVWGAVSARGISALKEKSRTVVVMENRPELIGLKHNIPLLRKASISYVYCTDNMAGVLFYKEKIDEVLLFYNELLPDNSVSGVSGSLYIALLAKEHGIRISCLPRQDIKYKIKDKDASTFDGRKIILMDNCGSYVVPAREEVVNKEVLN